MCDAPFGGSNCSALAFEAGTSNDSPGALNQVFSGAKQATCVPGLIAFVAAKTKATCVVVSGWFIDMEYRYASNNWIHQVVQHLKLKCKIHRSDDIQAPIQAWHEVVYVEPVSVRNFRT